MNPVRAAAPSTAGRSLHELRIRILHVPDCPLVGRLRADVKRALVIVGSSAVIEEIAGPFPSPTLLIGGYDVAGQPLGGNPACRLDLPTTEQIAAAILAAARTATS